MLRITVALLIDYLRWTQLTPLIFAWAIAFGILLLMLVTSNEVVAKIVFV